MESVLTVCESPIIDSFCPPKYCIFQLFRSSKIQFNRGRISSVGRAFDCRAGGRGFDSRGRTVTQGLKMTEIWSYFLCTAGGETFAWLRWPRKMAIPCLFFFLLSKQWFMQKFGGQTECITGDSKMRELCLNKRNCYPSNPDHYFKKINFCGTSP